MSAGRTASPDGRSSQLKMTFFSARVERTPGLGLTPGAAGKGNRHVPPHVASGPLSPTPRSRSTQARRPGELLDAFRAGDRLKWEGKCNPLPHANPSTFALHDAQLVMARAHGFDGLAEAEGHSSTASRCGGSSRPFATAISRPCGRWRSPPRARPHGRRGERRASSASRSRARPATGHRPLPHAAGRRRAAGHLAPSRRDHSVQARRRAWATTSSSTIIEAEESRRSTGAG